MYNPELVAKFREAINNLREFCHECAKLTEDEQKEVRHVMYQQTGRYGKLFTKSMLPGLLENERRSDIHNTGAQSPDHSS